MNYGINNLYPKPTRDHLNSLIAGQKLSITSGAAVSFAAFNINTSLVAVDIQTANVYATFDGTTPSSSNGHIFYAGDKFLWSKDAAATVKFIAVGTTAPAQASEFQV